MPTNAEARSSLCSGLRARALFANALLGLLMLMLMLMLMGGCSRTISQSTILHGHSAPREELREDVVRHNVEVGSTNGKLLRGWHLENPRATRMVVFFANNTTTLLENAASLWLLADALRADVVAFDYRGYGFSAGTPSLRGMLDDAPRVAAFAHVIAERRGLRIAVVGQSLGTFPAGRAAAPPWVEELILIAPAASVSDLVEAVSHTLPWYRHAVVGASLEQVGIDPSTDIAATQAELLLIHSARDPLLPLASTQRLLQASKAPRRAICKAPASYGEMAPTNSGVLRCMLNFLQQEKRQASPAEPPQRTAGR